MREPSVQADECCRQVIGAAIEVHRHLGPGHLERVYGDALAIELTARGVRFGREVAVDALYKGHVVGQCYLDFLVGELVIVELKAVAALAPEHRAQVLAYLRITGLELGLLLNFDVPLLRSGIERIVLTRSIPP